jgi:hypothetical protein
MWSFVRKWLSEDGPMKMVVYENMLYPQYDHRFQKTIDKDTWEWLQEQAKKNMYDSEISGHPANSEVVKHWQSIVDGNVPFGYTVKKDDE